MTIIAILVMLGSCLGRPSSQEDDDRLDDATRAQVVELLQQAAKAKAKSPHQSFHGTDPLQVYLRMGDFDRAIEQIPLMFDPESGCEKVVTAMVAAGQLGEAKNFIDELAANYHQWFNGPVRWERAKRNLERNCLERYFDGAARYLAQQGDVNGCIQMVDEYAKFLENLPRQEGKSESRFREIFLEYILPLDALKSARPSAAIEMILSSAPDDRRVESLRKLVQHQSRMPFDQVRPILEKIEETSPNDAIEAIGDLLFEHTSDVQKYLEYSLRIKNENPAKLSAKAWHAIGHAYVLIGDFPSALELLDKLPPNERFRLQFLLVRHYKKAEQVESANRVFDEIISKEESCIEQGLVGGLFYCALTVDRLDVAAQLLDKVDPSSRDKYWLHLAIKNQIDGRLDAVISATERIAAIDRAPLEELVLAELRKPDSTGALQLIENLCASNDKLAEKDLIGETLGALMRSKELGTATIFASQIVSGGKELIAFGNSRAYVDNDEVLQWCESMNRLFPEHYAIVDFLAFAYAKRRNADQALEMLKTLHQLDRTWSNFNEAEETFYALAQGGFAEHIELFRKFAGNSRLESRELENLARGFADGGFVEKAVNVAKQADEPFVQASIFSAIADQLVSRAQAKK